MRPAYGRARLVLILIAFFAACVYLTTDTPSSYSPGAGTALPESHNMAKKTQDRPYDLLVKAIPDGGSVSYDDLRKAVGDDVANLLAWANPKSVSRSGSHFTLESDGGSMSEGGATVTIAKTVELDLDKNSADLSAKNITGVSVSVPAYPFGLDLKEADVVREASGNVRVKTKLLVSRFLPYYKYELVLGPDGKPVK